MGVFQAVIHHPALPPGDDTRCGEGRREGDRLNKGRGARPVSWKSRGHAELISE